MLKQKFLLVFAILFSVVMTSFASDPGDKVEDFILNNFDGTPYSLSSVKDSKAVVVMFWSTTCPNVQPYNERIVQMANDYSKKGITFWAINANSPETVAEIEAHAKKNNYPFPVLK